MANVKLAGLSRTRAVRDLLERYENESEAVYALRQIDSDNHFDVTIGKEIYVVGVDELAGVFAARMANIANVLSCYGIDVSAEDPTPVGEVS